MKSPNEKIVGNPEEDRASVAKEQTTATAPWDHSTHEKFYEYYAKKSQTDETQSGFRGVRDTILRILAGESRTSRVLDVVDLGCGVGTQSMVWAELGHAVHALDINAPLVELGKERAAKAGFAIDFRVGLATSMPWPDESSDVCVALELLEHVADWRTCLNECMRVLRPGGALFLTTTNHLCPVQAEFNLPLYSWYPGPLKHHFERLAFTTRPDLVNYAKYPAVNWFTYYGLRQILEAGGFQCLDRFEMMNLADKGIAARSIATMIRSVPPLRYLAHVCTRGTRILALKRPAAAA